MTKHQGQYRKAWAKITSLEGDKEVYNSSSDGKFIWTVVDKVTDDDFKEIRKFKDKEFEEKKCSLMKYPDILKDFNYSESYWYL